MTRALPAQTTDAVIIEQSWREPERFSAIFDRYYTEQDLHAAPRRSVDLHQGPEAELARLRWQALHLADTAAEHGRRVLDASRRQAGRLQGERQSADLRPRMDAPENIYALLAALPTDPDALLAEFRKIHEIESADQDDWIFERFATSLSQNIVPRTCRPPSSGRPPNCPA